MSDDWHGDERRMQPDDSMGRAASQREVIAGRIESDIRHLDARVDKLERSIEGMRSDLNRHLIDQQPSTDRSIQRIDDHNAVQDQRIEANSMQIKGLVSELSAFRAESRKDTAKLLTSIWSSAIGVALLVGGHLVVQAASRLF